MTAETVATLARVPARGVRTHTMPAGPIYRLAKSLHPDAPEIALARALGVSEPTVRRWRLNPDTALSVWNADRVAIALGYHPLEVWGQAWWAP